MMTIFQSGFSNTSLEQQRRHLLSVIAQDAARTALDTGRSAISGKVMAALGKVDRRNFVPDEQIIFAYENHPLSIGHGQTISQPYIVALMTDLLDLNTTDRILEIGTGSGYQAAVLSKLVEHVYSVEIVRTLGEHAREKLTKLGYRNISVKIADGRDGWSEFAPYDAVIVTAAPDEIPPELVQQLKTGGKIVIPLGSAYGYQDLVLATKHPDGSLGIRRVLPVSFVPLVGGS
ncbi:MAG: protein-L-isoaspartate(D-aspartate) O-methyltransferase [Gallionellaceae bacterium]|jgi:protein-L-isoaspartate(D-aspartate) O-methyltransferase